MPDGKKHYCNSCGRMIGNGTKPWMEEMLLVEQDWGYFSRKDGEHHRFCLCEACYDEMIKKFVLPVEHMENQIGEQDA